MDAFNYLTMSSADLRTELVLTLNKVDVYSGLLDFVLKDNSLSLMNYAAEKFLDVYELLKLCLEKLWALYTKDVNPGYYKDCCKEGYVTSTKTVENIREMLTTGAI